MSSGLRRALASIGFRQKAGDAYQTTPLVGQDDFGTKVCTPQSLSFPATFIDGTTYIVLLLLEIFQAIVNDFTYCKFPQFSV